MSLKTKLIIAFLIMAAPAIIVGGVSISMAQNIDAVFDRIMNKTTPAIILLGQIRTTGLEMQQEAISAVLIQQLEAEQPGSEELQPGTESLEFSALWTDLQGLIAAYEAMVQNRVEQPSAREINQAALEIYQRGDTLIRLTKADYRGKIVLDQKERLEEAENRFLNILDRAIEAELEDFEANRASGIRNANFAISVDVLMIIMAGPLSIGLGLLLSAKIAVPIIKLKTAAEKVRQGQSGTTVELKSKDEIGILAKTFNQMVRDLQTTTTELKAANKWLQLELSKRRRAEEALRKSEEKYRNIFEHSAIGIFQSVPAGRFTSINPACAHMLGYESPEQVLSSVHDLAGQIYIDPQQRQQVLNIARESEGFAKLEIDLQRQTGQIWTANLYIRAVRDDCGELLYLEGFAEDITERKRIEEKLRNSEERFKILFEFAPEAYYLNDLNGNFVEGNRAAEEVVGYKRNELIGCSMLELNLVSPDQIEKVARTLKKNAAGIATGPDEFILTKKNGERVAVEISTYPITINRKSLVLGTAHDISNRKKIEAQIRKALRDKEILLQEIHHRVKNNLQIISSLLNLQSSFVDDPRTLEIFQESQNRVRSMALVHEKLYRSQDLTSIDLAEYIEELAHHLFQTHHLNSRKIYLKVETESVFIDLDRAIPCGLILNELISNALKHAFPAGQNGEVRVKLKIESPELLNLTVGDNGVGFPAHLDFSNAGTLGLQLVNTLVKQLGGTIELTVSHSTEFRVRFNVSP